MLGESAFLGARPGLGEGGILVLAMSPCNINSKFTQRDW
jgi:hypothetical protein